MSTCPLGDHTRKFREAERYSIAELAKLAGISKPQLWELEQGRATNPRLSTLVGLARATRTTLARIATLAAQQRKEGE